MEQDQSVDRLLAAVLPFHRIEDALRGVCTAWHELLQADAIVVGAVGENAVDVTAAVLDSSGSRAASLHSDGSRIPDAAALQRLLTSCINNHPADWIPLESCGQLIGGLLIGGGVTAKAAPIPTGWVSATARLVQQALAVEDQLLQDKLAALAELAAGAGHEINNPLGSILIGSERLLRDETNPERRRLLATLGGQALRIKDMIGDLMLFASPPPPQPTDLDLAAGVRDVAARFAESCRERNIRLEVTANERVPVHADPIQVAVVLSELLRNAINASPDGGLISLEAKVSNDNEYAILTVANSGPALTEHERTHLFDPFFSGRPAGRGLGFGLSKAWRIVTQHGGRIAVDRIGETTRFRIQWPAATSCDRKD